MENKLFDYKKSLQCHTLPSKFKYLCVGDALLLKEVPNLALQTKQSFVFAHVERGVRPIPPPNGDIHVATR
jgi:hypothetical protein